MEALEREDLEENGSDNDVSILELTSYGQLKGDKLWEDVAISRVAASYSSCCARRVCVLVFVPFVAFVFIRVRSESRNNNILAKLSTT
ncbi:hypothetical protein C5167_004614 [Papaver somniferum]|uniref:Uncharacterized protein n=1 Tax=Papaver somniferum TaxID=3469 RepID=A0A4Y7JBM3_PAPSO|nr:hypothetical protein C5167_004614 [Papaver somniferum]